MFHPDLREAVATALKKKTMDAHQALEDLLSTRLHTIRTREDYGALLKIFYGYFSPVEKIIEHHLSFQQLPDIKHRRKAAFLLHDLNLLSFNAGNIPVSPFVPTVTNEVQAWGALYVLEGSTLGGRGITRLLLKQCSEITINHLKFFNGYGEETGPMWRRFLESLNNQEYNDSEVGSAVQAANETFLNFKKWIEQAIV